MFHGDAEGACRGNGDRAQVLRREQLLAVVRAAHGHTQRVSHHVPS